MSGPKLVEDVTGGSVKTIVLLAITFLPDVLCSGFLVLCLPRQRKYIEKTLGQQSHH